MSDSRLITGRPTGSPIRSDVQVTGHLGAHHGGRGESVAAAILPHGWPQTTPTGARTRTNGTRRQRRAGQDEQRGLAASQVVRSDDRQDREAGAGDQAVLDVVAVDRVADVAVPPRHWTDAPRGRNTIPGSYRPPGRSDDRARNAESPAGQPRWPGTTPGRHGTVGSNTTSVVRVPVSRATMTGAPDGRRSNVQSRSSSSVTAIVVQSPATS